MGALGDKPDIERLAGSWGFLHSYRKVVRKRYPSVWKVPLVRRLRDAVIEVCQNRHSILDIGAHNRDFVEQVSKSVPGLVCRTMDIDPCGDQDYHSLAEIRETFDVAVMSEVIEHLTYRDGLTLLGQAREILNPGGVLVVSTPNPSHPNRFWDPDHKTPYRYDDLAGLLMAFGFEVEKILRAHSEPFPQLLIRRTLGVWIHRYLDVDFAKSVIVVARLPG